MKDSSTATERVGRYQLLEPIGGGPNGMVSRAKVFGVAGFERQFAVKRFSPELTVGAAAQALSAAARSYGSLEHPRIARMSEFGVAQGQTFTAVEYVAGLDAFRLLQEAKLAGVAIPAGGALALVSQAARAVGYAHGRGLSHLGLCPTNVIVTGDGDVKVTDFGILAATMPTRPLEAPRLAHRIPYLAPEQIAGESTSAATDVFVLGVIAYELVTGQRAYRGDTPAAVAQAILAGPPAEPPLPRPIVRVLQRCLARSPFERFPDARALADALDAALRVAPVPGTRKEIGAQIKATLERYAALNEGNLSGMVALNLGNAATNARSLDTHDVSTQPYMRPDAKTDVSPVVPQAATTLTDLPKPFSTVAGLAPPPIPVPPGVTPPPNPIPPPNPGAPKTMLGLPPMAQLKKPQVPSVIPPIGKPNGPAAKPPIPTRATPPPMPAVKPPAQSADAEADVIEEPSGLIEVTDLTPPPGSAPSAAASQVTDEGSSGVAAQAQGSGVSEPPSTGTLSPAAIARAPRPTPSQNFESQTGEMSSTMLDELNRRSVRTTGELESLGAPEVVAPELESLKAPDVIAPEAARSAEPSSTSTPPAGLATAPASTPAPTLLGVAPSTASTAATPSTAAAADTGDASASTPTTATPAPAPRTKSPTLQPGGTTAARPRSRAPIIALGLLVLGGLGAGGYYVYTTKQKQDEPKVATGTGGDKPAVTPPAADAGAATADAAVVATATPPADAAVVANVAPAPVDAGVAVKTDDASVDRAPDVQPTAKSDKLKITSKPKGARVFIDGADQGTTPLTLPGSTDRHTMVLLLPGHDLFVGEIDGSGVFDITLEPVTPSGGHAGIKVIKCKQKERYYVYVDGKPTGMTCPTERIDTVVGPHVVEVYDIVTDSRRKWDIYVKDERLSFRVRIGD